MTSEREARVAANEAVFRTVNDRVDALNAAFGPTAGSMVLVWECGNATCTDQIEMNHWEYERVRSDPLLFAVVPGHEIADLEAVVARRGSYDVVRKQGGVGRAIATGTDPRSA